MITQDLFSKILLEPASSCNQLKIITGYASPAMANKHFELLPKHVSVDLIVGMASKDGVGIGAHRGFSTLSEDEPRFTCSYVEKNYRPVHAKSYIWLKDGLPELAFTGSGNYSQNTFMDRTIEMFADDNPIECFDMFNRLQPSVVGCLNENVEARVKLYREIYKRQYYPALINVPNAVEVIDQKATDTVILSLLDSRTDETHRASGLNWGQRDGREPNQAYIPVPALIARSGFFPDRAHHFTLITDDDFSIDCVIAQDGDKAIHSTKNNSILGIYFRERIGVQLGGFVHKVNLESYGRTDVTIKKIDDETYFMDFSIA